METKWLSQLWRCNLIFFSSVFSSFPPFRPGESSVLSCLKGACDRIESKEWPPRDFASWCAWGRGQRDPFIKGNSERETRRGIFGNQGEREVSGLHENGQQRPDPGRPWENACMVSRLEKDSFAPRQQKPWTRRDYVPLDNGCLQLTE